MQINTRLWGTIVFAIGVVLTYVSRWFPTNLDLYIFSLPAGMVLVILGLVAIVYGRPFFFQRVLFGVAWFRRWTKGPGIGTHKESEKPLIATILANLDKSAWSRSETKWVETIKSALETIGRSAETEDLRDAIRDQFTRYRLALCLGVSCDAMDDIYFYQMLGAADQAKHLYDQHKHQTRFNRILLLAITIVLPVALFYGVLGTYRRVLEAGFVNSHVTRQIVSLLDNRQLGKDDFDDVADFLNMIQRLPLDNELSEIREILTYIFAVRDSVDVRWASAYPKFVKGGGGPKVAQLSGLWGPKDEEQAEVSREALTSLALLKGKIAARYTEFGGYDLPAIRTGQWYFGRANQLSPLSDVAYNGMAVTLKYELQHRTYRADSTFMLFWQIADYFDHSNRLNLSGFFRRAKYFNNKADLLMELIKTLSDRPKLLDSIGVCDSLPKPCEKYWRDIESTTRAGILPLLDTVEYYLQQARVFYPSSTPDFIVTRAQLYSLRSLYLSRGGNVDSARAILSLSCHLINSALNSGFGQVSVFYKEKRPTMYFSAFDEAWATECHDCLIRSVARYFPEIRNKL